MGKIKKILENELVGGTQTTDVYPVTSVKAVYDENNERLDNILNRRGVVNISTNYNNDHIAEVLTLSQAIAKVPSSDRTLGFIGTFLTVDGWKDYQFTGSSISGWNILDNWNEYFHSGNILQELGNSIKYPISQDATTKKFGQLGIAEIFSSPVLISPCITTYNSLANSNTIESGYWLNNNIQNKIRNIILDSVWLKFTKGGTITLLKGTGIGTSSFTKEVITKETVNVGWFPVKLPKDFQLNENEWLGIYTTGDTATSQLGLSNLSTLGYSFSYYSNAWHTLSDRDLLMYVTASFGKAIAPIPMLQSSIKEINDSIKEINDTHVLVDDINGCISPITNYTVLEQERATEILPTTSYNGGYYNANGVLVLGHLNTKGGEYDLTNLVGNNISVNLGTSNLGYVIIEDKNNRIIRRYQSLTVPLYFNVSSNMKTLKAVGFSIDGKQGVYSGKFVSKIPKVINDLATDSPNDALSASMGKMIYDNITYKEEIIPTTSHNGGYYSRDGVLHTEYSLPTKGGEYNLSSYIGQTLYVYLGASGSGYIVIEDTEGNILKTYQSLDTPLVFTVTDNMKTLKALGYVMGEYQGVYNTVSKFNLIGQSKFRGGTIITIGDSITAGYNTTKIWANILAEKLECTLHNYAVSGMQLSGGMTSKIDTITETSPDLIFLFGGTNDWAFGGKPLGEFWTKGDDGIMAINNSTDNFTGGVVLAAQKLLSKFPKAKIYFITPLHRKTYKEQIPSDLYPNSNGYYLYQYVDSIKNVCSYYSIPVIDLYSISGLNPNVDSIATSYFNHDDGGLPDLLHPDENGHERISEVVKEFING